MSLSIDTSDEGLAASANARAAILYARTCGMVADNKQREHLGMSMAWNSSDFDDVVNEMFPEWWKTK